MEMNDIFIGKVPMPGLLPDIIPMRHAAIVLFVVIGQILIVVGWWQNWDWICSFCLRILHLTTIVIVVVQSWLGQLIGTGYLLDSLTAERAEMARCLKCFERIARE